MKYAVIKTGGKQYRVSEGDIIEVEKLPTPAEQPVSFDDILLYTADGVTKVGTPTVANVVVAGKVVAQIKGDKLRVAKYKAKVRYRRVIGHRQLLSRVKIERIEEEAKKTPKQEKKA